MINIQEWSRPLPRAHYVHRAAARGEKELLVVSSSGFTESEESTAGHKIKMHLILSVLRIKFSENRKMNSKDIIFSIPTTISLQLAHFKYKTLNHSIKDDKIDFN